MLRALPDSRSSAPGGQGGDALPAEPFPEWSRSDVGMAAQAIRGRWPIRPEKRQEIIDKLTTIACNPGIVGPRESVAAAKALLDADRINMEDEARAVPEPAMIEVTPGHFRASFEGMTDDELERFIANGGK